MTEYSKSGQGAFYLGIDPKDGSIRAQREGVGERQFSSAQEAYDFYRPLAECGDHAAWNICYHLEDHLH